MAQVLRARQPLRLDVPRPASAPLALAALVVCAWLALGLWGASPAGRYLGHEVRPAGSAAEQLGAVALFVTGWVLMIVAMMLPTATGLLDAFRLVVRARTHSRRLVGAVVAGFVGVWVLAGAAFQVADGAVHAAVAAQDWLAGRTYLIAASAFAAAGAYQFTSLKSRCLTACRSPRGFVVRHWGGGRPGLDALRVGAAYGVSCVGCCWALMLLLFALGMSSLTWMLAVGAIMAAEKLGAGGSRLSRGMGVGLLATAVVLVAAA